jgi:hypothetical protein
MSRRRRAKSKSLPPFVPLTWELLNSKAYIELPHAAAKALPFFIGKPHCHLRDPRFYQDPYEFSYKEAGRLGFAFSTYHNIISALVAYGFIDPVKKGGLRGDHKSFNLFKNSYRWMSYGAADFVEMSWATFNHEDLPKTTSISGTNSTRIENGHRP